ncbi:MAG: flippase-like domain-containing protein [Chloroflexi bacterium]|nr:flippase-like domain-containing protein [Chloroflexota bacterium]
MRWHPNWRLWLGVAVSGVSLGLVVSRVQPAEAVDALRNLNYWWLLSSFALYAALMPAKAVRWRLLFSRPDGLGIGRLVSALFIGYFVNNVAPARLGEVARVYLIGRSRPAGHAQVAATIIVEKLLDTLMLLACVAVLAPALPMPDWAKQSILVVGAGVAFGVGVLVAVVWLHTSFVRLVRWSASRLLPRQGHRIAAQIEALVDELAILRHPGRAAGAVFWTTIIWLITFGHTYVVLLAFDLPVPAWASVMVTGLLGLGMTVPSSPGYIGVFQYATVTALALFDIGESQGFTFSVVLHVLTFLSVTVGGLYCVLRESLSLAAISNPRVLIGVKEAVP